MTVSKEKAKELSAGVWAVSFAFFFFGFFLLNELAASGVAFSILFFSVFIISPALAVYAYLRVTDADEDDVWHSLIDSGKSNDNGGPVSDDQLEITMVDTGRDDDPDPDSLDTLRERYATGELTDEQFEHKVDQLLQTNSPEHAAEWRDRRRETLKE